MNNQQLFKESLSFINENLNCLSNEVPQYLIEYWTTENFNNEDLKATEQWSVFMHILLSRKEIGVEFQIEIDEFEKMRHNWQNILAIISVNNLTEIKIEPFKVFDIENFEKLEIIRTE
jgi:hypothetical protein